MRPLRNKIDVLSMNSLLPNESGAVVGIVVWLGVERSAYLKRQGLKDFGLIDLPFPLRKMAVCPIGTLLSEKNKWRLERGVQSFPSVGDPVILPTRDQTIAIVTGQGKDSRVPLGTCPNEILHLVIAVSSRLILESLQRYRKHNNQNLPTVLVNVWTNEEPRPIDWDKITSDWAGSEAKADDDSPQEGGDAQ